MGLGFFGSLIVGGLAGWIASIIMKADTGLFTNILIGILGAAVLNGLLGWVGIYAERAWLPQLIVGALGAGLLIALYRRFAG